MSSRHKIADRKYILHNVILAVMIIVALVAHAAVFAQSDWKAEFDDICAKTDQAMTLSKGELSSLVERCDKLKASIEQLEETQKKVYLRRLELCRNLFVFVLESLNNK